MRERYFCAKEFLEISVTNAYFQKILCSQLYFKGQPRAWGFLKLRLMVDRWDYWSSLYRRHLKVAANVDRSQILGVRLQSQAMPYHVRAGRV